MKLRLLFPEKKLFFKQKRVEKECLWSNYRTDEKGQGRHVYPFRMFSKLQCSERLLLDGGYGYANGKQRFGLYLSGT